MGLDKKSIPPSYIECRLEVDGPLVYIPIASPLTSSYVKCSQDENAVTQPLLPYLVELIDQEKIHQHNLASLLALFTAERVNELGIALLNQLRANSIDQLRISRIIKICALMNLLRSDLQAIYLEVPFAIQRQLYLAMREKLFINHEEFCNILAPLPSIYYPEFFHTLPQNVITYLFQSVEHIIFIASTIDATKRLALFRQVPGGVWENAAESASDIIRLLALLPSTSRINFLQELSPALCFRFSQNTHTIQKVLAILPLPDQLKYIEMLRQEKKVVLVGDPDIATLYRKCKALMFASPSPQYDNTIALNVNKKLRR